MGECMKPAAASVIRPRHLRLVGAVADDLLVTDETEGDLYDETVEYLEKQLQRAPVGGWLRPLLRYCLSLLRGGRRR